MAYFLDLFSPETYEAFERSDRTVSGFRQRQYNAASRIQPGDKLVCYMTKLSRWFGILEVEDGPFIDSTPIFYPEDDPFVVRFHVRTAIWLPVEKAVPIHEDSVWNRLTFTRGIPKNTSSWTGRVRSSLAPVAPEDGAFLESLLQAQVTGGDLYPVPDADWRKMLTSRVRRVDRDVEVTVPDKEDETPAVATPATEIRESTKVQALLAEIGSRMGMQVWLPPADRAAVVAEWRGEHPPPLERLPLNYDDTTIRTIQQIDVLWLKGRYIKRAFEVEHTTSIYSGILRMADLLALQPNMDIRLHIVAPAERREKVFQEVRRPVFSLLDRGPLVEACTYLSYDSVRELAGQRHLSHMTDSIIDDFEESAEG